MAPTKKTTKDKLSDKTKSKVTRKSTHSVDKIKSTRSSTNKTEKIASRSIESALKLQLNNTHAKKYSKNISIFDYLNCTSTGVNKISIIRNFQKDCVVNHIRRCDVKKRMDRFSYRVTSIAWHPMYSNYSSAGSKGGELGLIGPGECPMYLPGTGPGGSIVGLKFNHSDPSVVYTSSVSGELSRNHFSGHQRVVFLTTESSENWFTCLDVSHQKNLILSGDCKGNGFLLDMQGKKIWNVNTRLHFKKISHAEFSPDGNTIATASNDHSVCLWDLRAMSQGKNKKFIPTYKFEHEKTVNSAFFNSSGSALLTTDQHSELRVYSGPYWRQEKVIPHPHRQFQHLTPIKATWHPAVDIIVVGRYPDHDFRPYDERTIDLYDGITGRCLGRLENNPDFIVSLNAFNISGDTLLSAASNVLYYRKINF